ncbi:site-specific integrase [Hymenobacter sp. BT770]|uniref:site-specific integrase n=1 Tax=Hymenobacter sp. BT770 TaxID=2886942 RepID=UPI001D10B55F|nr:site-specific integrase [Hymenobacter sp. BT770]MCC3153195.1 site-specific integrase [Hymenobacter sp. BT770]MDO3415331.1 site-specific integrase [Hymenobacter sp. BT770]
MPSQPSTSCESSTSNPKTKEVTVYAEYRHLGKCKRVRTGFKISERYWDNEKKIIRANGTPDVGRDNKHLNFVLTGLNEWVNQLYIKNGQLYPTIDQFNAGYYQDAAKLQQAGEASKSQATLVDALRCFIDEHPDWAPATRKGFGTLINNITSYQLAQKTTWLLPTLTNEDITKWQHWLLKTYDYKNATLGKRVRLLRQLLREKEAPNVKLGKVKPLYTQRLAPPVVLHQHEIEALRNLDLHFSRKLARVRDLMIAQIFSGLRFSDLVRLHKDNIQKGHIVMRMQKTDMLVRVPIFQPLQKVLNKYIDLETGALLLPNLSNQKFNEYIKELCQLIPALRKPVVIEAKKRDKTITTETPKWELISSHSSRQSFCTMCLELGYYIKDTMQWSGHRTLAAFSRYTGLTDLYEDAGADFSARYAAKLSS